VQASCLKNTYDGATADSSGFYSFVTEEKGSQQIEVTISGYNTVVQNIVIATIPLNLDITLKEQVTELKAVVISAGSFEASDKNKGAVLNSIDIVTTPQRQRRYHKRPQILPGIHSR
jgi:hypothetical protein